MPYCANCGKQALSQMDYCNHCKNELNNSFIQLLENGHSTDIEPSQSNNAEPKTQFSRMSIIKPLLLISYFISAIITGFVSYQGFVISSLLSVQQKTNAPYITKDISYALVNGMDWANYAIMLCLISVTLFIAWTYIAYKNMMVLHKGTFEYSPIWAIAGFLIPFLNLIHPYKVLKEIWQKSTPFVSSHRPVLIWWLVVLSIFIISMTMDYTAVNALKSSRSIQQAAASVRDLSIANALYVINLILTPWLVIKISAMQQKTFTEQ